VIWYLEYSTFWQSEPGLYSDPCLDRSDLIVKASIECLGVEKERVGVDLVYSFEMLSVHYQLTRENMEAGVHLFEDIHVVFPQDTGHYKYARMF
jgi:hypothetical protein